MIQGRSFLAGRVCPFFFQTPQPNLSMGMPFLLGGYASWWNHHHRQSGHVFQSRFHADIIRVERAAACSALRHHLGVLESRLDNDNAQP